jgi:hypothetical protein
MDRFHHGGARGTFPSEPLRPDTLVRALVMAAFDGPAEGQKDM